MDPESSTFTDARGLQIRANYTSFSSQRFERKPPSLVRGESFVQVGLLKTKRIQLTPFFSPELYADKRRSRRVLLSDYLTPFVV